MKRAVVLVVLTVVGGVVALAVSKRLSVPMAPGGAAPEPNTGPGSPS